MDIYENLQKSMVIYGICPCLVDDDYTFCIAKHLLMMPLHLWTRNLVNNWYFSLNYNSGPYPLFIAIFYKTLPLSCILNYAYEICQDYVSDGHRSYFNSANLLIRCYSCMKGTKNLILKY